MFHLKDTYLRRAGRDRNAIRWQKELYQRGHEHSHYAPRLFYQALANVGVQPEEYAGFDAESAII